MNPNSANQTWSKWVWAVRPGRNKIKRSYSDVVANFARFARKGFGQAGKMRIREMLSRGQTVYVIELLVEGRPVNDPQFVDYMRRSFEQFFIMGFGADTKTKMTAKLMAGSPQTGAPASQLLIMPSLNIPVKEAQLDGEFILQSVQASVVGQRHRRQSQQRQ